MDLIVGIGCKAHTHAEKIAPTDTGRALRHGGNVASEVVSYTHGNIPRALAWLVPNALYTAAYIPLAAHSLVCKVYNIAMGTQPGGHRDLLGLRLSSRNHFARCHLMPDDEGTMAPDPYPGAPPVPRRTRAPHLPYPGTMPSWETICRIVPGPVWNTPDYPAPPAASGDQDFDPNEKWSGLKDRSERVWAQYNEWASRAMATDAEAMGRAILNETFPAGHPQAGEPRYSDTLRDRFQPPTGNITMISAATNAALSIKNAISESTKTIEEQMISRSSTALFGAPLSPEQVRTARELIRNTVPHMHMTPANAALAAAETAFIGPLSPTDIDAINAAIANPQRTMDRIMLYRGHMQHLFGLNARNFNSVLQRDIERQEIEYTIKVAIDAIKKDMWYFAKYGYMQGDDYKSAWKEMAEKALARLNGLLQEVDPLHGRVSTATIGSTAVL